MRRWLQRGGRLCCCGRRLCGCRWRGCKAPICCRCCGKTRCRRGPLLLELQLLLQQLHMRQQRRVLLLLLHKQLRQRLHLLLQERQLLLRLALGP